MFNSSTNKRNIKLFAKKVFIMDDCKELVPDWMTFISGVVDCSDLQLNVSREMLQQNKVIKTIKKQLTKKIFEMMDDLVSDETKFKSFYNTFSKNLKLGVHEDSENRDKFTKFLRFFSSKSNGELISIDTYVERMSEGQEEIYYIIGDNIQSVQQSIFMEKLVKKGFEVIFMVENIDEYLMQQMKDYKGKKFVNITKDDLKFKDEEENKDDDKNPEKYESLCKKMKDVLGSKVEKVIISSKLTSSPACLSTGGYGWTANMERIMKAQALNNNPMSQFMTPKKTLEINPSHNIIKGLNDIIEKNEQQFNFIVHTVYDLSLLASGFVIENPGELASKLYKIIEVGGLDSQSLETPENHEETVDPENQEELNNPMEQVD